MSVLFAVGFVAIAGIDADNANAAYKVSYDLDGGSGQISDQEYEAGQQFYLPTYTGSKAGYDFIGWTDGQSQFLPNVSYTMPQHNVVFKAVWSPITYTAIFDANGGTGDQLSVKARYNVEMPNPSSYFSHTGYNMTSWNTAKDGTGTSFPAVGNLKNLTTTDMETITLYAQWQAKQFTVRYLYDDQPEAQSFEDQVAYDQAYTFRGKSFERQGYEQSGWTDAVGGEAKYQLEQAVPEWNIEEDLTLYPSWSTNTYTVTFNANGGTGEMSPVEAEFEKEVELPEATFTNVDHAFDSWNTAADGTGEKYLAGSKFKIQNDVTLYAQWTNRFVIYYDLTGGIDEFPPEVMKSDSNSVTIEITENIPKFKDHRFISWGSSAASPEKRYDPGDSITLTIESPEITIYAQWLDVFYMEFDAMGGFGCPTTQVNYSDSSCTFTIPDVKPTKPGFTFSGWATTSTGEATHQPGSKVTLEKDNHSIVFYAVWSLEATYSLAYSPNGGSGEPAIQYVKSNAGMVEMTVSNDKPSRSGYDFRGWSLTPEGAVAYQPGSKIELRMPDTSVVLYAVWIGQSVPVDGVEIVFAPGYITVDSTVKLKAAIHPDNATQNTPTWTSSDQTVATISSDGVLKGISSGTVTITASAENMSATVKVKVTDPLEVAIIVQDGVAEVENVADLLQEIEKAKESGTPVSLEVAADVDKVVMDPELVDSLAKFDDSQTVITAGGCEIVVSASALSGIPSATSAVTFTTKVIDTPEEYADLGGDKCVDLTVSLDGKTESVKFDDIVIVKLDYELKEGDNPSSLTVLYINDNGETEVMKECFYEDGKVWFTTDHFSMYMVKFDKFKFAQDWSWIMIILAILVIILLILLVVGILYSRTYYVDGLVENTPLRHIYSSLIAKKNGKTKAVKQP